MGVRIQRNNNSSWKEAGIKNGFVITHIDNKAIGSAEELIEELNSKQDGYSIKGVDEFCYSQIIQID